MNIRNRLSLPADPTHRGIVIGALLFLAVMHLMAVAMVVQIGAWWLLAAFIVLDVNLAIMWLFNRRRDEDVDERFIEVVPVAGGYTWRCRSCIWHDIVVYTNADDAYQEGQDHSCLEFLGGTGPARFDPTGERP